MLTYEWLHLLSEVLFATKMILMDIPNLFALMANKIILKLKKIWRISLS